MKAYCTSNSTSVCVHVHVCVHMCMHDSRLWNNYPAQTTVASSQTLVDIKLLCDGSRTKLNHRSTHCCVQNTHISVYKTHTQAHSHRIKHQHTSQHHLSRKKWTGRVCKQCILWFTFTVSTFFFYTQHFLCPWITNEARKYTLHLDTKQELGNHKAVMRLCYHLSFITPSLMFTHGA